MISVGQCILPKALNRLTPSPYVGTHLSTDVGFSYEESPAGCTRAKALIRAITNYSNVKTLGTNEMSKKKWCLTIHSKKRSVVNVGSTRAR